MSCEGFWLNFSSLCYIWGWRRDSKILYKFEDETKRPLDIILDTQRLIELCPIDIRSE